jgi:hypothetical protein
MKKIIEFVTGFVIVGVFIVIYQQCTSSGFSHKCSNKAVIKLVIEVFTDENEIFEKDELSVFDPQVKDIQTISEDSEARQCRCRANLQLRVNDRYFKFPIQYDTTHTIRSADEEIYVEVKPLEPEKLGLFLLRHAF